jgi:hypothetical protein
MCDALFSCGLNNAAGLRRRNLCGVANFTFPYPHMMLLRVLSGLCFQLTIMSRFDMSLMGEFGGNDQIVSLRSPSAHGIKL